MQNILLSLFLIIIVSAGCNPVPDATGVSCGNVSSFTVVQHSESILVSLNSNVTPLYYEVSVNLASQPNLNPKNGVIKIMDTVSKTFTMAELGMQPGLTYLFYVRTACENKSKWSAPISITASSSCDIPTNLEFIYDGSDVAFKWSTNDINTSFYQVEYGNQGFVKGTGTVVQVNGQQYSGMTLYANQGYDFYVRAYCNGSAAWSSWVGPSNYYSITHQNPRSLPLGLNYNIVNKTVSNATIALHWVFNGATLFDYAVVHRNAAITASDIHSATTNNWPKIIIDRYNDYDFYMRSTDNNGSKSAWSAPISIYIK